ncbi:MAG TPA: thiosulfate oxidation carrier protein SoxY [Burkholderiales bacterium]|nr:thiosulfate oxidation carrier protein SoxY [Burkholderiales bacterium]
MNPIRRALLQSAGALAVALLSPLSALAAAWNKEAFGAKTVADALKSIGAADAVASKDVLIDAPEIAENGAVVPIEVTSNVPGTRSISVIAENNPFPLVGRFDFMEGALPYVKLNLKLAETADVRVIAEARGKHYSASKNIKVTIGGCGG